MTDAIKGVVEDIHGIMYLGGDPLGDLRLDVLADPVEYDGKKYAYDLRIIRAGVDRYSSIALTFEGARNLRAALDIMIARLDTQRSLEDFA